MSDNKPSTDTSDATKAPPDLTDKVNKLDKRMDEVFRILDGDKAIDAPGLKQRVRSVEEKLDSEQRSISKKILNWTRSNVAILIAFGTLLVALVSVVVAALK